MFDGDSIWPSPESARFSRGEAWVDLIQMAAFRDGATVNGIRLERGEFCGSLRYFARRWTWSIKEVRGFLGNLLRTERIRAQSRAQSRAHVPSVYLLVNYEKYNPPGSDKGTAGGTDEGKQRARSGHKDEEGKKEKKESFQAFWANYPRRAGGNPKAAAQRAFEARLHEGVPPADIIDAATRYARFCEATAKVGTEYVKQAQYWLSPNYRGWEESWAAPANDGDEPAFPDYPYV